VRVLLSIHHELDPDLGAPGATIELGRALRQLGHEVEFLSFEDAPGRLPALAKEAAFPVVAARHVRRAARSGADVIDASTGDAWLWAKTRGRRSERPLLVTRAHGLEHRFWDQQVAEAELDGARLPLRTRLYHGRLRLLEVRASLRSADRAVFLNGDDRDYAIARLGIPGERAVVIQNGLPPEFLGLRRESGGRLRRVAHVGSWTERKGVRYLSSALSNVLAGHGDLRASLLGTHQPATAILADFDPVVRERIDVVPHYRHGELPGLLAGHQAVVSASLAEGFSLALPEAMACGLAPIATTVGGSRDLLREEQNGLLVPPRDPQALEAGLTRLVEDQELLDRLGAAAHRTAQALSWTSIAEQTLTLYERGLAELG
jgi:glycosyltransferase involved in cell wall biosynthesis